MTNKRIVPVLLTTRQAWLIVEQMEKGSYSWDDAKIRRTAEEIAKKIRRMLGMVYAEAKP